MKHLTLILGALLALPATIHAASPAEVSPRAELKAFLNAPQNKGATLRMDDEQQAPALLKAGDAPLARAEAPGDEARVRATIRFLEKHARLYRLHAPAAELSIARQHSDELGMHHYRLQQHLDAVPIRGAQLLAHFNADDELRSVSARTVPTPEDIDTSPAVSMASARMIAHEAFESVRVRHEEPVLEIRSIEGEWRLTWTVESFVNTVNRWQTVIDAHGGRVLRHYPDRHESEITASGKDLDGKRREFTAWAQSGRYHLVDVTLPVHTNTESPLVRRSDFGDTYVMDFLHSEGDYHEIIDSGDPDGGWDAHGVSALVNAQAAYRYFSDVHGHHGTDGKNANILLAVHYGDNYDNAFWSGKWMVFGDGGQKFVNLPACTDIVGHEMSHGVIEHTAGLIYENQSGALNESFADLFGSLIEGRNWTIGEACTKPWPGYLRDMADPHQGLRGQPRHMSEYVERENTKEGDWGGVHVNSGIPNRAAYLLTEGLSDEGLGRSIGSRKVQRLYFRALSNYLASSAQFIDLRRALLLSADDLYPGNADVNAAIHAAFDAVGIVEGGQREADDAGRLRASASKLDFGDVALDDERTYTLRLTNAGEGDITIHEVAIDGEGFSHSFTNTLLGEGQVFDGEVTFAASLTGTVSATLEVHHDAAPEPVIVDLYGTGVSPRAVDDGQDKPAPASGGGAFGWLCLLLLPPGWRRGVTARTR